MKTFNRRKFFRKAGVSAAGVMASAPLVKTGWSKASPNETVQVAVMGIRSRGRALARHFAAVPNVKVAALCDIDEQLLDQALGECEQISGQRPRSETDIRRVLDDADIDAIAIASPNHWHALATIWACQAGKDVYVEKPASHNIWEGRQMVEAARRYDRIVQIGTQNRSDPLIQSAMQFLHDGKLGKIYMIKCLIFNPRESIGRGRNSPVPPGVHYDLWVGPAAWQPFNPTRFHYNWHWFWNTGNGETGNNGPHFTDMARWALQQYQHPIRIQSMGAFDILDSEQETPNTQISVMEYENGTRVQAEVRGLCTNDEGGIRMGLLIFGSQGWMRLSYEGWETFFGREEEPGEQRSRTEGAYNPSQLHCNNFIDAVRSRNRSLLNAEILEGHLSTSMCHLANIAYRVGRQVCFDPRNETFAGDEQARSHLRREYRYPFEVSERV